MHVSRVTIIIVQKDIFFFHFEIILPSLERCNGKINAHLYNLYLRPTKKNVILFFLN